jgi:hypothetical protein
MEPFPSEVLNQHGGEMHATYVNEKAVGGTTWSWDRDGTVLVAQISRLPNLVVALFGGILLGVLAGMVSVAFFGITGFAWVHWETEGYCEWEGQPNQDPDDPDPAWYCKDSASESWDDSIWWGWCEEGDWSWQCTDDYGFDASHALSADQQRRFEDESTAEQAGVPFPVKVGLAVFGGVAALGLASSRGVNRFELDPSNRVARLARVMPNGSTSLLHEEPVDDVAWAGEVYPVVLQWQGQTIDEGPLWDHLAIALPPHHLMPFVQSLRRLFGHDVDHADVPDHSNVAPATIDLSAPLPEAPVLAPAEPAPWETPAVPVAEVPETAPLPPDPLPAQVDADAAPTSGDDFMPKVDLGEDGEPPAPFW